MSNNIKTSSTTVYLEFLLDSGLAVKLTMAKLFKPLTNVFPCVAPVVNCFLTRAIANLKPSYLWLVAQVGTLQIPVAAPRAVIGIFGF